MRKAAPGTPQLAEPNGPAAVQQASFSPPPMTRVSQRVDLVEATQGGTIGDYRLSDGDVVVVHEEEPRFVYAAGLVNEPQQVEIPPGQDLRVLDVLTMAGGRRFELADKIHVIRQLPHLEQPVVIEVSVREAKKNGLANLIVGPSDIVSVEETPITFVLGAIQQVLRFGVSGSLPLF
jgi:protein involved in polysaccharide export with SLBB domain